MLIRISIACLGLMTGFFFAFSVTVMPGLDDTVPGAAIEAMQGINRLVRNPVFFACFFGGAAVPLAAAAFAIWKGRQAAGVLIGAAGMMYLGGVIVLTAQINVPMNNALALVDAGVSPAVWVDYSKEWTYWNHVRTAVSVICLLLGGEALRRW